MIVDNQQFHAHTLFTPEHPAGPKTGRIDFRPIYADYFQWSKWLQHSYVFVGDLMRNILAVFVFCAAIVAVFGRSVPADALDSGHHADITVETMREAGYQQTPAYVAQVENWFTDYYTSAPTTTISKSNQCYLEKLHFDDLFTQADVANYWATLAANTKAAVQQAASKRDYLQFLVVMGVSLHVVQDFYSHSNWNEIYNTQYGMYSYLAVPIVLHSASWFDVATKPANIRTGWYPNCLNLPQGNNTPHGGYYGTPPSNINPFPPQPAGKVALNHDSYVRPGWQGAYAAAYAASREWIDTVDAWADQTTPGFSGAAKTYTVNSSQMAQLSQDQQAALYISEWVSQPGNFDNVDGHWKGNPSGYLAAFTDAFAQWTENDNSVFVNAFVNGNSAVAEQPAYLLLSKNLYTSTPGVQPPITVAPASRQWFILGMRTTSVTAIDPGLFGLTSYFATLRWAHPMTPAGTWFYNYRDASYHHESQIAPFWDDLLFVPASTGTQSLVLQYTMTDEYDTPSQNQVLAINGAAKALNFTCTLTPTTNLATPPPNGACTGDVSIKFDNDESTTKTFTGSGSDAVTGQLLFSTGITKP